jgi:carboxyl-terminal processing protease
MFFCVCANNSLINKSKDKPKNLDFGLFWQIWNLLDKKYVGDADSQKKIYGAISGMVDSLGDPYTTFLPPTENNQFQDDLSGSFEGIGAEIASVNGKVTIVSPLEGSPAKTAGLLPKDVIEAVDNKSTEGIDLNEVVKRIRGKAGTEVTLSIVREGWDGPKDIKVKRGTITVKSVRWEMKENNIGYIQISQFGDDTYNLMEEAVKEIKGKSPKGIIIDLRNNPGGLLDSAVNIISMFINSGDVVKIKYKDGHVEVNKTTRNPIMSDVKMAVLVNSGSASASEIFAGAIQDHKRGVLIGEKTFGKGSVQDLETLKDGSALKVTIAKWFTPNGHEVDKKGIEPDIKISSKEGDDIQLKTAIENLNK